MPGQRNKHGRPYRPCSRRNMVKILQRAQLVKKAARDNNVLPASYNDVTLPPPTWTLDEFAEDSCRYTCKFLTYPHSVGNYEAVLWKPHVNAQNPATTHLMEHNHLKIESTHSLATDPIAIDVKKENGWENGNPSPETLAEDGWENGITPPEIFAENGWDNGIPSPEIFAENGWENGITSPEIAENGWENGITSPEIAENGWEDGITSQEVLAENGFTAEDDDKGSPSEDVMRTFLLNLMDPIETLTNKQMREFKIQVSQLVKTILD